MIDQDIKDIVIAMIQNGKISYADDTAANTIVSVYKILQKIDGTERLPEKFSSEDWEEKRKQIVEQVKELEKLSESEAK